MMARGAVRAAFVFLFMAFLSLQAATGFMRDVFAGGVYPRAMRAIDWLVETVFTGPLGRTGGAIMLLVAGLFLAFLAWKRAAKEEWE